MLMHICGVGNCLAAGSILCIDRIGEVVDQCAKKVALMFAFLLAFNEFIDLSRDADKSDDLTVVVPHRDLCGRRPAGASVSQLSALG